MTGFALWSHHRTRALQKLVLVSLIFVQGCSFIEHWDENGLPCDTRIVDGQTNFCLSGYTCFNPSLSCIKDQSRNLGQACTDARQCQVDELCPIDNLTGTGIAQQDDVQTCLRKCHSLSANHGYYQFDGCDTNFFCAPFLDGAATNGATSIIGACVPNAGCTPGDYCTIDNQAGGSCVAISDSATACLPHCDIHWTPTASYTDNCATATQYCQPVGLKGAQQFSCLDNTRNQQVQSANCNMVDAPCANGSVCSPLGTCAPYCRITGNAIASQCATNQVCCTFTGFISPAPESGYCADSCP